MTNFKIKVNNHRIFKQDPDYAVFTLTQDLTSNKFLLKHDTSGSYNGGDVNFIEFNSVNDLQELSDFLSACVAHIKEHSNEPA